MSQTSYSDSIAAAFAGQKGDGRVEAWLNSEASDVPAGILVEIDSEGKFQLMTGATTHLAGGVINSFARDPGNAAALASTNAIKAGAVANLMVEGSIWLLAEEAMAVDDDVFVRHTANGAGKLQLGAVRNDNDSNNARQVTGARVLAGCSAAGPVLVYLSVAADTSNV